jgi:glycosyltransferase involved in cell wall biosynthesis
VRLLVFSSMAAAPWGGSEELWAATARAALARGHPVALCLFDWQPTSAPVSQLIGAGAKLITRPPKPARLTLEPGRAWLEQLDALAPDAVLLSQGSALECVARRATRPLLAWLTSSLRGRQASLVNLVQFNKAGVKTSWLLRRRARALHSRAAANLFVCARNFAEAGATLGGPIPRASVARNPVNLRDTSSLVMPPIGPGQPVRLACVGRLACAVKGQDLLLRALASARSRGAQLTLTLAGVGPDRASLETLSHELGLGEHVTFAGQITDLRALWAQHHALVLASHAEGTPLAMVEAMLLGRPAIVTDVGGCADWVRPGLDGQVVPPGDVAQLAGALARLAQTRDNIALMGASARARALDLYEPDAGGALLDLIERSLQSRADLATGH